MKLIECYISSFGKLKDYKLSFDNNLTVINRENAYGKTTLSIFIKSMFYGLDEAKRDVDKNTRVNADVSIKSSIVSIHT